MGSYNDQILHYLKTSYTFTKAGGKTQRYRSVKWGVKKSFGKGTGSLYFFPLT
jgi:hypothetical protein